MVIECAFGRLKARLVAFDEIWIYGLRNDSFKSIDWFLDEGNIEMEKVNVRQQPPKCVP